MKKHLIIMLIVLLLAACSSSDSNDGSTPANTNVGVFKDSNVAGLAYTSGSQSGVTNANGEFTYEVGQTVTFSIGGVALGTVAAEEVITPVDLVPDGTTDTPAVQNIVRFLMMLDDDGDPDNGIAISTDLQTAAETWSQVDFQTDDLETELSAIITSAAILGGGLSLNVPDVATAQAHMESTLRCTYAGAFSGSFSGDDNGNFGMIIDAKTGAATGLAYSEQYDNLMELIGNTPLEYSQNPSFVSGAVSGGATYEGQFSGPNTLSGSWTNHSDGSSGTYSGSRIGGAIDAAYRFTGQFSGDGYGLLAFDMDDANNITGIAYSIDGDELINLTGSLSGTSLTVRSSDGTTATGTLNTSTGEMNGTWTDDEGGSGVFTGCGCKLN